MRVRNIIGAFDFRRIAPPISRATYPPIVTRRTQVTFVIQSTHLFMKALSILVLITGLATATFAADKASFPLDGKPAAVLNREVGKQVELRLKSGDKISGKVGAVGTVSVHLTALTGQEFYDAVIDMDDITAVVIRNDGK